MIGGSLQGCLQDCHCAGKILILLNCRIGRNYGVLEGREGVELHFYKRTIDLSVTQKFSCILKYKICINKSNIIILRAMKLVLFLD